MQKKDLNDWSGNDFGCMRDWIRGVCTMEHCCRGDNSLACCLIDSGCVFGADGGTSNMARAELKHRSKCFDQARCNKINKSGKTKLHYFEVVALIIRLSRFL